MWIISRREQYETSRLLEASRERGCDCQLMNPENFDILASKNSASGIRYQGSSIVLPDVAYLKFGAAANNFQLSLTRQLENAGVICVNKSDVIETVKNKMLTYQVLSRSNIAIPNTMLVRFPVDVSMVKNEIGFPAVVKVISGSHGNGVYLCERMADFEKLMEFINSLQSKKTLIVQEYCGERPGEDLRILVVGGKVIGAMKRIAPVGDFRANISAGGSGEPYTMTYEIEQIALETSRVLGLDVAGIDLLFDTRGFRVCEANSNPGFSGFEKYCGLDVAGAIVDYLKFRQQ
jgi:gamma-F420-2:alpha-L-glutamate ligase